MSFAKEANTESPRKIFVLGRRIEKYPRTKIFTETLRNAGDTQVKELERPTILSQWRFVRDVSRLASVNDRIIFLFPAHEMIWGFFFARLFFPGKIIGDAFISQYDSLVNDRALASPLGMKAAYYHLLDQLVGIFSDILIFDTEENAKYFSSRYFLRRSTRTAIIPVFLDLSAMDKIPKRLPAGTKEVPGRYFILFYGNYIPLQGVQYILRAFALLPERNRFRLMMVGRGQVYNEALRLRDELHLRDVELLPRMPYDELLSLVKSSDLALGIFGVTEKASRVIPNKLLEPMALGVPVVMGRNSPSERYFKDNEEVYYCRMGDPEDIARAILSAYEKRSERARITANARRVLEKEFSAMAVSGRLRALLDSRADTESGKKIAFLLPHLRVAGGTRIVLEYASRLEKRGHFVTIYVQSANYIRRTVANVFRLGYPNWIKNFSATVLRVPAMTPEHIHDADVVIATTYKTALTLGGFPKEKGRQFYLLQHDEGLYHGDRTEVDRTYRLPQRKIVVATWLKELLKNKYDIESDLLINPIDRGQFRQLPREVNDGTIRVLLLHHTYDWKGTKEGARVVNELKKKYSNIRLVMFGARKEEAEEFAPDEYHFNVPQEKLASLYSNCDIFLCPSWDEGFGLPSVEAMACGIALVTYDNGGSRDFAFHEKTALVAPRKDEKALQNELERLVNDPVLRVRIAREGKIFVDNMPGWDTRTEELEKMLLAA